MSVPRPRLTISLATMALAIALASSGTTQAASTSSTVVGATVPTATTLDASLCAPGTPGVTALGSVTAGSTVTSSTDCVVEFGSSNDTSRLRMFQADGYGTALAARDWATRPIGTAVNIESVEFISETNVWAVGDNGVVRHSTDGGGTWSNEDIVVGGDADDDNFRAIHFVDESRGWIISQGGEILRTTDGGSSWTSQYDLDEQLNDIESADANTLWAVSYDGTILHTTNGGTTWTPQVSGSTSRLYGVSVIDDQNVWVSGQVPQTVLVTSDGGATWTQTPSVPANNLWVIEATTTTEAWVTGSGGQAYKTADGGTTWTGISTGSGMFVRALVRVSATEAWAAGDWGTLHHTTNGGSSWTAATTGTAEHFRGLARSDAGQLLAVGYNGTAIGNPSSPIPDYDEPGGDDWGAGTSVFGACVDSVAAGAAPTWPVHAGCALTDGAGDWHGIPVNSGAAGVEVATAPTTVDDAIVNLRFGFHADAALPAGTFLAPIAFDVLAP
jgi:photosystem II stability/assembly factor-like uncharacterized protein